MCPNSPFLNSPQSRFAISKQSATETSAISPKLSVTQANPFASNTPQPFPNGKNQEILIHRGCFQTFKQVGVISASQTTVSGDQHIAALLIPGFSGIYRGKICIPPGNIHKGLMHGLKIGPADFRPSFALRSLEMLQVPLPW